MKDRCSFTIEPPKIHNGRVYLYSRRKCKRRATVHGRCWQHHQSGYYCDTCKGSSR